MDGAVAAPRVTCVECFAELSGAPKFCPECGARVVAADAGHGSRRTVTMLFTDVTGSTSLGERLDPEAYRTVMGRYFAVARRAIEFHGGTVEKFVGDAVLAVFGVPEVREDDALRAVRAAHDLATALRELSRELEQTMDVTLLVRTGVNTGSVVTGTARAGGSFATGDAVNTAARLEQAAGPGEILLGHDTWVLVREAVEVEEVDPVAAKGKAEPVAAYRLLEVRGEADGRARRSDAPLIGRQREARALEDALERTVATGRSHLVTVVGPAGAGKSRLVAEFLDRVGERAEVLGGRCVSYGDGITYWPIVQVLRQALSLSGAESDEVTRHALTHQLGDTTDGAHAVDVLLPLLGKGGAPGGSDQTFWAVGRLLEALALRRPVVVTVDDLHWAEPTLLDLLQRVHDDVADLPLLLLCQARPELLDEHPGWGRGSVNSQTFGLDPLSNQQVSTRLEAILGAGLPPLAVEAVTGWSGGNPLFIEEIAAHLVEEEILVRIDETWVLTSTLTQTSIPPSIAALLAARLQHLPDDERRLLECAAVIGLDFTTAHLSALTDRPDDLPRLLSSLSHRDLLRRNRGGDEDSWAIRHVLVRNAAYAALPKTLRAELHERFAASIDTSRGEGGSEGLAFVAHHLEKAARYRTELAPHDPATVELASRAVIALMAAADAALDREDLAGCDALLRRALDLVPGAGPVRRDVLVALELLSYELGEFDEVGRLVDLYEDSLDVGAADLERAHIRAARLNHQIAVSEPIDPELAVRAAEEELTLARAARDRRRAVLALYGIMGARMTQARWGEADKATQEIARIGGAHAQRLASQVRGAMYAFGPHSFRRLLQYIDEQGDPAWQTPAGRARTRVVRGAALAALGAPEAAGLLEEAWRELEEQPGADQWRVLLGEAYGKLPDLPRMIEILEGVNQRYRELGDLGHASTYICWQALAMLEDGRPVDEAMPLVEEAATCTSPYDVISTSSVHAARSVVAARTGDLPAAREHALEAVRVIDTSDQVV
ncbi:MAG: ATP-binding protein, partial [Nocardioides sp.]